MVCQQIDLDSVVNDLTKNPHSLVLSTYKEPVPGWTDNLYGPSGLCVGTARGFVHAIYGNSRKKANLVPADYCVNAMIASAWDINRR